MTNKNSKDIKSEDPRKEIAMLLAIEGLAAIELKIRQHQKADKEFQYWQHYNANPPPDHFV